MRPTETFASALVALFAISCATSRSHSFVGVDVESGKSIALRPTAMPAKRTFSGVYRSPHLGELQLEQRGSILSGSYEHEVDECVVMGEVHGEVRGNLAVVQWHEDERRCSRHGQFGGTGFFLYDLDERAGAAGPAKLFGRRQIHSRILPMPSDPQYAWLNAAVREEAWTAVEIPPRGPR